MKKKQLANMSDCQLVEKLKEGDVSAYEQLFARYYRHLKNFIDCMVKNDAVSEDMAQNVFMKLWILRGDISSSLPIKSWLFVLARNETLNFFKKMKPVLSEDLPENELRRAEDELISDPGYADVGDASIMKEISKMPGQRQRIFYMSRYESLSNKEIADALNISVRTVEKHISLAIKDMRNKFN